MMQNLTHYANKKREPPGHSFRDRRRPRKKRRSRRRRAVYPWPAKSERSREPMRNFDAEVGNRRATATASLSRDEDFVADALDDRKPPPSIRPRLRRYRRRRDGDRRRYRRPETRLDLRPKNDAFLGRRGDETRERTCHAWTGKERSLDNEISNEKEIIKSIAVLAYSTTKDL